MIGCTDAAGLSRHGRSGVESPVTEQPRHVAERCPRGGVGELAGREVGRREDGRAVYNDTDVIDCEKEVVGRRMVSA